MKRQLPITAALITVATILECARLCVCIGVYVKHELESKKECYRII